MMNTTVIKVLPIIFEIHCVQLKKLNASKEKNIRQKINTQIEMYDMYFPGPRVLKDGLTSSWLSWAINMFRMYGCNNATSVNEDAASPGVFEKVSMLSPKAKPHSSVAHCGHNLFMPSMK